MTSRPLIDRFNEKVDFKNGPLIGDGTRCHLWIATIMPNGYGQIRHHWKALYAHRVAWELKNGPIEKGLYVLHRCDNRRCVNPEHMRLGTFDDNMADMVAKRRQAHGSKNGHAKLVEHEARAIREMSGTHKSIADRFGVSRTIVSQIKSGKIWRYC